MTAWVPARRRKLSQKGQRAEMQQKAGQKDAHESQGGAGHPVRGWPHHRPKVDGKGEQRAGDRLRRPIAGQKRIGAHPPGHDHSPLQQRQHHVPSPEDERARPVERIDHGDRLGTGEGAQQRQSQEQPEERKPAPRRPHAVTP